MKSINISTKCRYLQLALLIHLFIYCLYYSNYFNIYEFYLINIRSFFYSLIVLYLYIEFT